MTQSRWSPCHITPYYINSCHQTLCNVHECKKLNMYFVSEFWRASAVVYVWKNNACTPVESYCIQFWQSERMINSRCIFIVRFLKFLLFMYFLQNQYLLYLLLFGLIWPFPRLLFHSSMRCGLFQYCSFNNRKSWICDFLLFFLCKYKYSFGLQANFKTLFYYKYDRGDTVLVLIKLTKFAVSLRFL